jgi:hypothetical protein
VREVQIQLDKAKNRGRSLRESRVSLTQRLADAGATLLSLSSALEPRRSRQPGHSSPSSIDYPILTEPSSASCDSMDQQACPKTSFTNLQDRHISSFAHAAPITLDIVKGLPAVDLSAEGHSTGGLFEYVRAYKARVAADRNVDPSDVCWFLHTPFTVPKGDVLSFSSSLSSVECCTSFCLFFVAISLHHFLLSKEWDLASGASVEGAQHVAACIAHKVVPSDGIVFAFPLKTILQFHLSRGTVIETLACLHKGTQRS